MGQNSSQPTGFTSVNADTQPITEDSSQAEKARHRNSGTESTEDAEEGDLDGPNKNNRQSKKHRKRKRPSTEVVEHGQEGDGEEPELSAKKIRHKKRKRISQGNRDDEETESAFALVDLRNSGQNRKLASSQEDDFAASAQLQTESSPITSAQRPRLDWESEKPKGSRKKKTTRLSDGLLEPEIVGLSTLDTVQESSERDAHSVSRNGNEGSCHLTPLADQAGLPTATWSLDDIDSNDEAVSDFLEGDQRAMSSPTSLAMRMNETPGREDDLEDLAIAALGDEGLSAHASWNGSPRLPSLTKNSRKAKKVKEDKRRRVTGFTDDTTNDDRTGQLNYTVSTRSATEDFWSINFDLTDKHFSDAVNDIPLHPRVGNEGHSVMQMENQLQESDDFETSQHVKAGKLRRIPSRKRKQKLSSHTNGNIIQTRDENNLVENHQDAQDYALPCSEDLQDQMVQVPPSGSTAKTRKMREKHSAQSNRSVPSSSQSKSRSSQRPVNYNPSLTELARKGGMFTASEIAQLHHFRDNYCAEHSMSHSRFATDRIHANAHNNPTLSGFWTELAAVLPYRHRTAIQKCCRRQFHPYEKRGSWTKDEDRMLREAVELKGRSWVAVGQICERLPEDCRDRYRNYICNAEVKNERGWTDQEIKELCQAVGECIYLLRADKRKMQELGIESETDAEDPFGGDEMKYVNWQIVSERMNGVRSRIQCSYKFKALKQRDRDLYMRQYQEARKNAASLEKKDNPRTTNWRLQRARKKVEAKMLPGDRYDVLQAVFHCNAETEEGISWKMLGKGEEWRNRWGTLECKVAWEMMKEEGEEWQGGYKEVAEKMLLELMDKEGGRLEERWVGEVEDRKRKNRKQKEEKRKNEKGKGKAKRVDNSVLSKEFVDDSNEEVGQGTTHRYDGNDDADQSNVTVNSDDEDETFDRSNIDPALMDMVPSTNGTGNSLGIGDDDGDAQLVGNVELLRNA